MTEKISADEGFSEIQLKRRKHTIEKIIVEAYSTQKAVGEHEHPVLHLENILQALLIEAYNAGYADCQNETQGSLKFG